LIGGKPSKLPALDLQRAAGRHIERADEIHEGGLARPRSAGDGEIFAALDRDADALQRADDAAAELVGLDQVAGDDLRGRGGERLTARRV
jgi:hypothetical protein